MIKVKQRSFLLPKAVTITSSHNNFTKIKYYTDCVFNPHVIEITYKATTIEQNHNKPHDIQSAQNKSIHKKQYKIEMDFSFLIQLTQQHPKILDNIGIINFIYKYDEAVQEQNSSFLKDKGYAVQRLGILVTNENNQLYVSLIQ